jgi:peptide-methionine (R)-S-oxide reductase
MKEMKIVNIFLFVVFSLSFILLSCLPSQKEIKTDSLITGGAMMEKNQSKNLEKNTTVIDKKLWKKKLTPLQYEVAFENGTEPAFDNIYWNNHEAGIYVDIVTGDALFSSTDKFDSGTGWPSFTKPITSNAVKTDKDTSFGMERDEVRSGKGDIHLGHVFDDGPAPTGLRYCMNSASLTFVPVADMAKEGYADYMYLFPEYKAK